MTDETEHQGEVAFGNGNSFGFIKPDSGGSDVFFHISARWCRVEV
ncbi:MAG: cold shock domain-containing protein [Pseudolabrys sp.]